MWVISTPLTVFWAPAFNCFCIIAILFNIITYNIIFGLEKYMKMEIFMKENGIDILSMGRESMSIVKMEEKKLDTGLKIRNKESLNAMTRVEHLLIQRFMRVAKKSS